MNRLQESIILEDGRTLAYAEVGDSQGEPIFLFHGLHSSRLEVVLISQKMRENHIRIIAIDRAGVGESTFQENRTLLDTVDDVLVLATSLNIEKFSVIGISSGAKYALACAYKIPHRLYSVFCLSSGVPIEFINNDISKFNQIALKFIQKAPWLIKPLFWLSYSRLSQDSQNINDFLGNVVFPLDKIDKELLFHNSEIKEQFALQCKESYRQGVKGNAYDARFDMLNNTWGFNLEAIDCPHIYAWHGSLDKGIPLSMAKILEEKVKDIEFKALEGEGHLTLVFEVLDEVIEKVKYLTNP